MFFDDSEDDSMMKKKRRGSKKGTPSGSHCGFIYFIWFPIIVIICPLWIQVPPKKILKTPQIVPLLSAFQAADPWIHRVMNHHLGKKALKACCQKMLQINIVQSENALKHVALGNPIMGQHLLC